MGYRVYHEFADGSSEDILDEVFDTYEDAEEAAMQADSDYTQGGGYLEEAGISQGPECIGWTIVDEDEED